MDTEGGGGSGGDAVPQLVPAQLGKGVQGAIPVDHCPLLLLEGDFQAGTSPDAVPQGWKGETAIGLRAGKAVLSTVGFYTNKKKYHRQAALPLWGGCKHPAAVVAVACAGVTGGEGLAVADSSCLEVLLLLCPS